MRVTCNSAPILIVEDDRKMSYLLAVYLAREGFNPVTAYHEKEGLELAAQRSPLLAILDVMLPHADGWEVCRHLRISSAIPILFL